jgi:phosphonate transport system substrate-binding protein
MLFRRSTMILFSVLLVASLVLAACQPAAATEVPAPPATDVPTVVEEPTPVPPEPTEPPAPPEPTEVPEPEIGSPEHPIKVLFVPSAESQVIVSGGQVMADALNAATGLTFEVSVPTSYAATIEEMCASPEDSIGFIPALGYVLANQLCGVDVSFKAIRNNLDHYYAQILVARDSDIETLEDLEGKTWGFGDVTSTSGYMVPLVMLNEAGVTPGETVQTGGHPQSVSALYNGEVDFATTFFSPPLAPEGEEEWEAGDEPDVADDLVELCAVTAEGDNIDCGGWTILDARRNILTDAPDVVQKIKILAISPQIPNDTLSFAPDFPAELRAQIEEALIAFAETEEWANSIGSRDFYGWTGLSPAADADYDFVRKMVEETGYTP